MFNSLRDELESTVAPLVREIVDDARRLLRQEAQLVRAEAREEGGKMRQALTLIAVGATLGVVSLALAALMLVYFVASKWLSVPLWMAFGLVAISLAVIGGVLSLLGGRRLRAIRDSSSLSMQALREGMEWTQRVM